MIIRYTGSINSNTRIQNSKQIQNLKSQFSKHCFEFKYYLGFRASDFEFYNMMSGRKYE